MSGTGKAGENGQSSVWVAKLILDQTVGCSTREGVYFWVNQRYCDRYRLGHRPVISYNREGSMYSQAHISMPVQNNPKGALPGFCECGSL